MLSQPPMSLVKTIYFPSGEYLGYNVTFYAAHLSFNGDTSAEQCSLSSSSGQGINIPQQIKQDFTVIPRKRNSHPIELIKLKLQTYHVPSVVVKDKVFGW